MTKLARGFGLRCQDTGAVRGCQGPGVIRECPGLGARSVLVASDARPWR
ncbi:MAG: hypothetical protein GY862_15975 [Gammaproteobacteria bacterium]|nr:hypothetical protein [Gammaproteobacteria bacterium]